MGEVDQSKSDDLDQIRDRLAWYERRERHQFALAQVRESVWSMRTEADIEKVLDTLRTEIERLEVPVFGCAVHYIDAERYTVYSYRNPQGARSWMQTENIDAAAPIIQVWRKGEPLYRPDLGQEDKHGQSGALTGLYGGPVRSVIDIPFSYGLLTVNHQTPEAFTDEHVATLVEMAGLLDEGFRRLQDIRVLEERNATLEAEITAREKIERELIRLERLRALGELSAGVSHNLNNLLTSIIVPLDSIRRKAADPQMLRDLESVGIAAERAQNLVQRLHQSVHGVEEGPLQPVAVEQVIREAVDTTRPRWKDQAQAQGIAIEVALHLEEVPPIQGTTTRLHELLTNLILNAVDALPAGGAISIATRRIDNAVELTFADSGTGMDEETRKRVFEPFFTTKKDVGSGLGLSTAHATIARWGGLIAVNSAPDEGTTFSITLLPWTKPLVEPAPPSSEDPPAPSNRCRVLLVDDELLVLEPLTRILSATHDVDTCETGREALARFEPGRYHIALIDLGLGEMPGDEIARRLRAADPLITLILITGWELPGEDDRASAFDFILQKPFGKMANIERAIARGIDLYNERATQAEPDG